MFDWFERSITRQPSRTNQTIATKPDQSSAASFDDVVGLYGMFDWFERLLGADR
jgi:hypothetical protein